MTGVRERGGVVTRGRNRRHRKIFAILFSLTAPSLYLATIPASASSSSSSPDQMTPMTLARVPGTPIVYLMGYVKCGTKLCLRLARTSNEGATFTAVTPPPVAGGTQVQYVNRYELVFANRNDGFAEVGLVSPSTFYVTFNGAKTWQKEKMPFGNRIEGFATTSKSVYAVTVKFEKKLNEGDGGNTDYRLARSSLTITSLVEHTDTEQQLHLGISRTYRGLRLQHLDLRAAQERSTRKISRLRRDIDDFEPPIFCAREHRWVRTDGDVSRDAVGRVSHRNAGFVLLLRRWRRPVDRHSPSISNHGHGRWIF